MDSFFEMVKEFTSEIVEALGEEFLGGVLGDHPWQIKLLAILVCASGVSIGFLLMHLLQ
jgi:hypothetical protein